MDEITVQGIKWTCNWGWWAKQCPNSEKVFAVDDETSQLLDALAAAMDALRWYAEPSVWQTRFVENPGFGYCVECEVVDVEGSRARAALDEIEGEE